MTFIPQDTAARCAPWPSATFMISGVTPDPDLICSAVDAVLTPATRVHVAEVILITQDVSEHL
jgi:hypothetical protein